MRQRLSPLSIALSVLTLAGLGLAVWWMSDRVVWLGDDLDYKYVMKGEIWQSWGWIDSWQKYWESQWTHYLNVNGRFVAHALVQLFNGILGQKVFAIFNGIVYILFALMIAKVGKVRLGYNFGGLFSAVCLSLICFVTKMMPTCQISYIWGMTANLIWLQSFFAGGKKSIGSVIAMSLAGILIGNWQESISIGVCAGLGIWWISQFFDRHKTFHSFFDWRRSWIMLGYFIGTATVCLSPGTLSRLDTTTAPLSDYIPFSDQLLVAGTSLTGVFLLLVALILLCLRHRNGISFTFSIDNGRIPDGVLIVAMLSLLIFNALIGVYSGRQLFGANLFAIILLLRTLPHNRLNGWLNLIAFISTMALWAVMYAGIKDVRTQYDDISKLHSQTKNGRVEYDRTRVMTLGHPLAAKYYEDILGQFDNDLHHSLMKDFKHTRGGKTLVLWPTTKPDSLKVERFAPGHFYVTVESPKKGEHEREVTVYGHYSLLRFINFPAAPRKLKLLKYSRRSNPYSTAIIIPEYPFFNADSIGL